MRKSKANSSSQAGGGSAFRTARETCRQRQSIHASNVRLAALVASNAHAAADIGDGGGGAG